MKTTFIFLIVVISFCSSVPTGTTQTRNKLLFLMLDGFRHDYVQSQPEDSLPGFNEFLNKGVRAEYMSPVFPSLSYPDWTTLVTGLYPESHGIVGNYIYDPEDKTEFSLFDSETTGKPKWWTAEPIWTTATKAGLKVAVIDWSRCDVPFNGVKPEFCEPWVTARGDSVFKKNIEKGLAKFKEGFDFVQIYYEYIDTIGTAKGPDSPENKEEIRKLDNIIANLQTQLEQMGLTEQVNVVIVSDHGMTSIAPPKTTWVELDDYLLTDYVENIADAGAFSNIKVKSGYVDQVYDKLKTMPGVKVYKHEDIPERYHYKNNKYVHDIILSADIDTWIMHSKSKGMLPTRPGDDVPRSNGSHGFSPDEKNMKGIFFAQGPDFQSNAVIPNFQNVDVYPLIANLLQVDPLPNNGTIKTIGKSMKNQMMKTNDDNMSTTPSMMTDDDNMTNTSMINDNTTSMMNNNNRYSNMNNNDYSNKQQKRMMSDDYLRNTRQTRMNQGYWRNRDQMRNNHDNDDRDDDNDDRNDNNDDRDDDMDTDSEKEYDHYGMDDDS